ncbi:MAG: WhiB family transcriptional regulator [Acidimicrobiales bacterium]
MSTPAERTRRWRQRKAAGALGLPAEPDGRTRPDAYYKQAHEPDPAWRIEAACRKMSPAVFFGVDRGDDTTKTAHVAYAKQVCAGCLVTYQCLDYALRFANLSGVWGGKSEQERKRLRKGRGRG